MVLGHAMDAGKREPLSSDAENAPLSGIAVG